MSCRLCVWDLVSVFALVSDVCVCECTECVCECVSCEVSVCCKLQHVVVFGRSGDTTNKMTGIWELGGGRRASPLTPPHTPPMPGTAGGLLDGTDAHMANHSSRAEVFSKGPGSNLKRDCLHRGQRPSGQERPNSCWPLRDRHINS